MPPYLRLIFSLLFLGLSSHTVAQCNGSADYCDLRYDEMVYITTHNAYNYEGAFLFPNHTYPVSRQLEDGVRGLMLDVYVDPDSGLTPVLYHSFSVLGTQPLVEVLNDIRIFLEDNPTEIVTIILECYVDSSMIEGAMDASGLLPYAHSQVPGFAWPTLQEMIDSGKRLVMLSDNVSGPAFPWYQQVWSHAVETGFSNHSRADFSCNFNRGDSTNPLFIVNHFITHPSLGYGLIDSALAINSLPYIFDRVNGCRIETGKVPNFLTIDFHEQGDAFLAAEMLNSITINRSRLLEAPHWIESIGPNPFNEKITLKFNASAQQEVEITLTALNGQRLHQFRHQPAATQTQVIETSDFSLPSGVYLLRVRSETGEWVRKIRKI